MIQSVRDPSNAVVPRDSADKGVPRDVADDGVPTMEYQKSNDGDVPRGPAENLVPQESSKNENRFFLPQMAPKRHWNII